jgi:hypothetical protein
MIRNLSDSACVRLPVIGASSNVTPRAASASASRRVEGG